MICFDEENARCSVAPWQGLWQMAYLLWDILVGRGDEWESLIQVVHSSIKGIHVSAEGVFILSPSSSRYLEVWCMSSSEAQRESSFHKQLFDSIFWGEWSRLSMQPTQEAFTCTSSLGCLQGPTAADICPSYRHCLQTTFHLTSSMSESTQQQ